MNGAFYCRSELSAPWGLTLPPMPGYLWFHVATSGECWLEADGAERDAAPARRPRARAARRGTSPAQRTRRAGAGDPRARAGAGQRPLRDPSPRRRRRADDAGLRRRALRPPGRRNLVEILPATIHIEAPLASAGVDAEHAATDGRRGQGATARWRGRDHAPRRHPRDPGDPLLDRDRPGRADAAGSARCRTDRSAARSRSSTASRRGRGRSPRWRASWRCRARPSPPASPSSSASRPCTTSRAGGCTWR